jgi:tetratricopeptide (TPR) repeat protein
MWSKLSIILGLVALCSIVHALNLVEHIDVRGDGELYARTNGDSTYDDVAGKGESQNYTRELNTFGYGQSKLTSSYTYRNNKYTKGANGRYEAGLKVQDGIDQTIIVRSNTSIDSTSTLSYENGDIVNEKSNYLIEAIHGNLTEFVKDNFYGHPVTLASARVKGNFTLSNELNERYIASCSGDALSEILGNVVLQGAFPIKEIQVQYPQKIVMEGKVASGAVQSSYYKRDAIKLINAARNDKDKANATDTYEKALNLAENALEQNPNDSDGWTIKGEALFAIGRIEDADVAYDKAVNFNKENTVAIFGRAETLFLKGQYRQALDYYDRGLNQSPNEADYWFYRANALEKLGEYNDSIVSVDKYINLKGDEPKAILFKANLQYYIGDYKSAKTNWEKGLGKAQQTSDIAIYYYYQGLTYEKTNEWGKAITSFATAKTLNTDLTADADIEINYCNIQLNPPAHAEPNGLSSANNSSLANA